MDTYFSQAWNQTTSAFSADERLIKKLEEELVKAYSSKTRHYHNLRHIETMLRLTEEHEKELNSPTLVKLAIFYHDVVYKSSSSDNEEKSAQLASDRLFSLGVPQTNIVQVADMILATKTHQSGLDNDTNFLLDFDLAILGASWETYLQYSLQIRKEYSIYPDFLYHNGRKKVLQHFLEQESIYKTAPFQTILEQSARQNLAKELSLLTSP